RCGARRDQVAVAGDEKQADLRQQHQQGEEEKEVLRLAGNKERIGVVGGSREGAVIHACSLPDKLANGSPVTSEHPQVTIRRMLDPGLSRVRQKRLLDAMAERKLDAIVVGEPQHVYYLSAFRPQWQHQAAFVLFSDGRSWLISANAPADGAAADECA